MEAEKEFIHEGLTVTYKFRQAKQDRRHLIVIFTGFRPRGRPYDFDGEATEGLRANILWIRDLFDGDHAYYIKNQRGYAVAEAVAALIDEFRTQLGLDKEHCTLVGFSKGGTGALYHSLAYDYPNLLIAVPRMRIGTGNIKPRPHLVEIMAGSQSPEAVKELDEILPNLLEKDTKLDRNIYLISSEKDGQFRTEIAPFLDTYSKYQNFNFIKSSSALVTRHVDVTPYNLPIVLSILHALGEGLPPRLGSVENGAEVFAGQRPTPTLDAVSERGEIVAGLDSMSVVDGRFVIGGYILRKGTPVPADTHRETFVRLESSTAVHEIQLNAAEDRKLSYRHFEHEFCDYNQAKFESAGTALDSLEHLEPGIYNISIRAAHGEDEYLAGTLPLPRKAVTATHRGNLYQFREVRGSSMMIKRPVIGPAPGGTVLGLKKSWAKGNLLHVEGEFIVPGQPVPTFDSVKYFLCFQPRDAVCSPYSVRLATGIRRKGSAPIGDPFLDFSRGYFGTKKHQGIEIDSLNAGKYELWVTAEFPHTAVVSRPLGLELKADTDGNLTVSKSKAKKSAVPVSVGGTAPAAWAKKPMTRTRMIKGAKRRLRVVKRRLRIAS